MKTFAVDNLTIKELLLTQKEGQVIEAIRTLEHGKLTVILQDRCIIRIVREESIKL